MAKEVFDRDGGPADLVQKLGELLPGFEARVDEALNAVIVRGLLKISSRQHTEHFYPAAADDARLNTKIAEGIAKECRQFAIEATGLEQLIAQREGAARMEGIRAGRELVREASEKAWDEGSSAGVHNYLMVEEGRSDLQVENPYRKGANNE